MASNPNLSFLVFKRHHSVCLSREQQELSLSTGTSGSKYSTARAVWRAQPTASGQGDERGRVQLESQARPPSKSRMPKGSYQGLQEAVCSLVCLGILQASIAGDRSGSRWLCITRQVCVPRDETPVFTGRRVGYSRIYNFYVLFIYLKEFSLNHSFW